MKKVFLHSVPPFLVRAMCSALMIISCEDDKPKILTPVIQFSANLQNVVEGDEATILLTLDKPASANGSVELTLETNAVYGQHFEADPTVDDNIIVLQVEKGEESAEIRITTVDNEKHEGARFILFQISSRYDDFRLGEQKSLTLTIGDDEGPSVANFVGTSAILQETEENGIPVEISFTAPAKGEGSLTVSVESGPALIGTHFTIDQEMINQTFSFNVVKDMTGVSFEVVPVNNDLYTGNFFYLVFTITEISGVVQKGNSLKYSLYIYDDELPSAAKFALPSGTISETDGEGIIVEIPLSSPVKGEGTIGITLAAQNSIYGTDFTTLPQASNNRMMLTLSHDQTSASFKVFPIDNEFFTSNAIMVFSIAETGGVVKKGTDSLTYQLTIVDDEEPSIVTFAATSASIDEMSSQEIEVEIQFSYPASGTGRIVVEVESFEEDFTTVPALKYVEGLDTHEIVLDVALHDQRASFKILPVNNTKCSESEIKTFTISGVSGVIRKVGKPKFELTIVDDEDPMIVSLEQTEAVLNESDAAGKVVVLEFSKPAAKDGLIWVSLDYYNLYYAGRYTTVPAMEYESGFGNYASLAFRQGHNNVSFKVVPVNDQIAKDDVTEAFHLSADSGQSDGCVEIQDTTYRLTIVDND